MAPKCRTATLTNIAAFFWRPSARLTRCSGGKPSGKSDQTGRRATRSTARYTTSSCCRSPVCLRRISLGECQKYEHSFSHCVRTPSSRTRLAAQRVTSSGLKPVSQSGSPLCRRSGFRAHQSLSANDVQHSRAYLRLAERFGEVRTLLELCSSPEMDSQTRRSVAGKDAALLRGALVLLCSHLEGFFEELIEDALHGFDLLAPTVAAIPLAIRKKQVIYRLRLAEPADLDRDWRRLLECVAHPLLQDDHPCLPGTRKIDSELHIKGFANPGTSEIDWLMASIGVSECWPLVAKKLGGRHGADTVNAVVNRRNQIAHRNLQSPVARTALAEYGAVLEMVVREI